MPDYFDLPPTPYDSEQPGTREYAIVQWCDERLKRGIQFLESQIGYDKIALALDELFQYEKSTSASYVPGPRVLSKTRANLLSKIAEDVTAQLTDVRCFWKYSTKNAKIAGHVKLLNDSAELWYSDNLIDLRIGDVMRQYTVAGTGVAHLYYSRQINEMMLESEDPRNVFPIDPMSYHSFEDCLGVITRRPRTSEWVLQEFGKNVQPDSGSVGTFFGWIKRVIEGPGERSGPLSKKSKADHGIPGTPTVFVNTMYLKDSRVNKTGQTVRMGPWSKDGKPETPWSYEVKPNKPLYPLRRIIVWCDGILLHDGPSPYWHAKFPLIKFTLNPWPGTWFGKAPLWDCIPLQQSMTANLRVVDDHAAQVAQPGVVADRNVSKAELQKVNTRAPGMKIRTNTASGKGIEIVRPAPLDPLIWEIIKWAEEKMKLIAGTVDPSSLAALGQIPSDDTIDTLMKAMSPAVRLRSRILEGAYKLLAYQYLYCATEFDTVTKRVAKFGPQAVLREDFDYSPGTMIPDAIPDGEPGDIASLADALGSDEPMPLYMRARLMNEAIATKFDPASLLNSAAQQELMQLFMLAKMGYVSVFTLMEKIGKLSTFAPPGMDIPVDEISRLQLQQTLGIGMLANAQGRKSTDQAPPAMGSTGNGPTITTS